jgi:hypothetical protein
MITLITASTGAALSAIGTTAILSAAAVVLALGLQPLVGKALDFVDRAPKRLDARARRPPVPKR